MVDFLYEPREDSFLLESVVKKYAKGKVLDIGTGTGIQALAAKKKKTVTSVTAIDVHSQVIEHCKQAHRGSGVVFQVSDLFENIKGTFDTIIFNPPYLPQEGKERVIDLEGGKEGHETITRFIASAVRHLSSTGQILLLFSSLSRPEIIIQTMQYHLFDFEGIASQKLFFEELFVYRITKSKQLRELEEKGVKNIAYFSHGRRGIISTGMYRAKKVAIKTKLPSSEAKQRIQNEAKFLAILNKKGIGPALLLSTKNAVVYRFIDGAHLKDWILNASKKHSITALQHLLRQCFTPDELGIAKEEMLRPFKNVIVHSTNSDVRRPMSDDSSTVNRQPSPVLIDFERCHYTEHSHNVSQFCQYLRRNVILEGKGILIDDLELTRRVQEYHKEKTTQKFEKIVELVQ